MAVLATTSKKELMITRDLFKHLEELHQTENGEVRGSVISDLR